MTPRDVRRQLWVVCVLSGLTVQAALPAEYVITADPVLSNVRFTLGGILHSVHGMFKVQSGTIHFDPQAGTATGQVMVDVASGNSGNPTRDHRMHKEVLQSQAFPEAVFAPDRVSGAFSPEGDSEVLVHGTLRIHGGEHEVTLPVKLHIENGALKADAQFVLPYVEWGMKNPSNLVLRVDPKVALDLHLVGAISRASRE
jgi:polyisoprenoid-binding protein YceI